MRQVFETGGNAAEGYRSLFGLLVAAVVEIAAGGSQGGHKTFVECCIAWRRRFLGYISLQLVG